MLSHSARRILFPNSHLFGTAVLSLALLLSPAGDAGAVLGGWVGVDVSPGPTPVPRQSHSLTSASATNIILFGGTTSSGQLLNDTWVLQVPTTCADPSTWGRVRQFQSWPLPRKGHLAVHDTHRNEVVVFGGQGAQGLLSEVWAFSVATRTWRQINATNAPCPRTDAAGVYDPNNQRLVVFGGTGAEGPYRDTWALDLQTATWSLVFPNGPQCDADCIGCGSYPSARANATAVFDPQSSAMILHGGSTGSAYLDDPWVLDLGPTPSWAPLSVAGGPYVRSGHVAARDPLTGRIVYQGGRDAQQVTASSFVMWSVGGSMWQREDIVAGVLPPAWENHAGVWASGSDELFILNCTDPVPPLGNLWRLSMDSTPPANITDFTAELVYCRECFCCPPILQPSAEVCWSGVGDDGLVGRPCIYEVRWNHQGPLTEWNWSSSNYAAPSLFDPSQGAGQQVCTTAFPCGFNTFGYSPVWIAVRASDERGNWSAVSNSVLFDPASICQGTNALSVGDAPAVAENDLTLRVSRLSGNGAEFEVDFGEAYRAQEYHLAIYDVAGRRVGIVGEGTVDPGTHRLIWDPGTGDATYRGGMYFAQLRCGNQRRACTVVMGQ